MLEMRISFIIQDKCLSSTTIDGQQLESTISADNFDLEKKQQATIYLYDDITQILARVLSDYIVLFDFLDM